MYSTTWEGHITTGRLTAQKIYWYDVVWFLQTHRERAQTLPPCPSKTSEPWLDDSRPFDLKGWWRNAGVYSQYKVNSVASWDQIAGRIDSVKEYLRLLCHNLSERSTIFLKFKSVLCLIIFSFFTPVSLQDGMNWISNNIANKRKVEWMHIICSQSNFLLHNPNVFLCNRIFVRA